MKTLFYVLVLLFVLSGCATVQEKVVVKTEYSYSDLPLHLKKKCAVTVPPDPKVYPKLNAQHKEELLTVYSINLLGDLNNCKNQISEIVRYDKEQSEKIRKLNK